MDRAWWILAAVSASFFFASATTFQSLGLVLFAMQGEFGWSQTATGGAFLALGLAACAAGLLPVALIRRIGPRWTLVGGALVLAAGFTLAGLTGRLTTAYAAAALLGLAFPLTASVPGTYLIAGWFGPRASRMIGIYLMAGTLGGAAGPPLAELLIAGAGGWRLYWAVLAGLALAVAAACALLVREPAADPAAVRPETAEALPGWRFREALRTPQFAILALAVVSTQAGLVTVSSVAAGHFARLGWPAGAAAGVLGAQALVGTAATGLSGWLTEHFDARRMIAGSLLAQAAGLLLLTFARTGWPLYSFVVLFGIGWSVCRVGATVLLIRYFGQKSGTAALSAVWMLCGSAAAGPPAAGLVADMTGGFAPALTGLALLLLPLAAAALVMAAPQRRAADAIAPQFP